MHRTESEVKNKNCFHQTLRSKKPGDKSTETTLGTTFCLVGRLKNLGHYQLAGMVNRFVPRQILLGHITSSTSRA